MQRNYMYIIRICNYVQLVRPQRYAPQRYSVPTTQRFLAYRLVRPQRNAPQRNGFWPMFSISTQHISLHIFQNRIKNNIIYSIQN